MICGKGGYVRSIARDLGQKLGCLGHIVPAQAKNFFRSFRAKKTQSRLKNLKRCAIRALPIYRFCRWRPGWTTSRLWPSTAEPRRGSDRVKPASVIGALAGRDLSYGDAAWASCMTGEPVAVGVIPGRLVSPHARDRPAGGFKRLRRGRYLKPTDPSGSHLKGTPMSITTERKEALIKEYRNQRRRHRFA